MADLPPFLNYDGCIIFPQPFQFKCKTYSFAFETSIDALMKVCDQCFNTMMEKNPPEDGFYLKYVPLLPFVNIIFVEYTHAVSLNNQAVFHGSVPYREAAAGFLMVELLYEKETDELVSYRLTGFTPYLWLTSPIAMGIGREVYGLNKTIGEIDMPSGPNDEFYFRVRTEALANTNSSDQAKMQTLFEIKYDSSPDLPLIEKWEDSITAYEKYFGNLFNIHPLDPISFIEKDVALSLHDFLGTGRLHGVAGQQFRDIQDGDKAFLQRIINYSYEIDEFIDGGLILHDLVATFYQCDQFPVAKTFNLTEGSLYNFSSWLEMQFTFRNGITPWSVFQGNVFSELGNLSDHKLYEKNK